MNLSTQLFNQLASLGEVHQGKNSLIFFGHQGFTENHFNHYSLPYCTIKQVHGNHIVSASSSALTADGHFSSQKKLALLIKTADCMPVMIEDENRVWALHIGWRGLAQKILSKAFMTSQFSPSATLWVGPHIHQSHFALDQQSINSLLKPHLISWKNALENKILVSSPHQKDHWLVNLVQILQIEATKLGLRNMTLSDGNTFTSHKHYSHRRNRHQSRRNLSFILKL